MKSEKCQWDFLIFQPLPSNPWVDPPTSSKPFAASMERLPKATMRKLLSEVAALEGQQGARAGETLPGRHPPRPVGRLAEPRIPRWRARSALSCIGGLRLSEMVGRFSGF